MGAPRQLPLDLDHAAQLTRDDLVVSAANRAAVAMIDDWPRWPSPVVVIAGPPGSGKSHLAAIWAAAADADVASVAAGAATALPDAAPGAVVIDAVDAAMIDERALFHLINAVQAAGGHLLMTARRFPAAWGVRLPDLSSRLKAATLVGIEEPDDALLSGVITKLFADRQVAVDPNVVEYLVRRIERSLAAAIRVVDRLDRAALEQKTRITRALAAEVLREAEEDGG